MIFKDSFAIDLILLNYLIGLIVLTSG